MEAERKRLNIEQVSVADATESAVDLIRQTCEKKNIKVEMDLDGVEVETSSALIVPAIANLLSNAIASMPYGGELSVTLVETHSQWELEVADSGPSPSRFHATPSMAEYKNSGQENEDDLPTVIEFQAHRTLLVVDRLARSHNSTVQTYPCPLGGSAHVLIVPKFAESSETEQYKRAG